MRSAIPAVACAYGWFFRRMSCISGLACTGVGVGLEGMKSKLRYSVLDNGIETNAPTTHYPVDSEHHQHHR